MRRRRLPAMSIVKRITTRLAMVVATATVTVVPISPSYATTYPDTALATSTVGYGYFNGTDPYNQVLAVHDSHADGYGVAILYYRYDLANTGPYYAWNRYGNGTTSYYYFKMRPGAAIKLYACPEKGGIVINYLCGSPVFAQIPYLA